MLFVCAHGAVRSPMAAANFNHRAHGRASARSAALEPADQINPKVIQVMSEVGLDLSGERPRALTVAEPAPDWVVTFGCTVGELAGKPTVDGWDIPAPDGGDMDGLRKIRDQIDQRVQRFLSEVLAET